MATVKINTQDVDEALKIVKAVIAKGQNDLAQFEKIISLVLTDENVRGSKKFSKLAETNQNERRKRKDAIDNAVDVLNSNKRAFDKMVEAFEL